MAETKYPLFCPFCNGMVARNTPYQTSKKRVKAHIKKEHPDKKVLFDD